MEKVKNIEGSYESYIQMGLQYLQKETMETAAECSICTQKCSGEIKVAEIMSNGVKKCMQ